uniref:Uncharacterized protein n=1 Tax=Knipowitschia caucasica TaxID=637954 RepID=A0AAV2LGE7_KNICA
MKSNTASDCINTRVYGESAAHTGQQPSSSCSHRGCISITVRGRGEGAAGHCPGQRRGSGGSLSGAEERERRTHDHPYVRAQGVHADAREPRAEGSPSLPLRGLTMSISPPPSVHVRAMSSSVSVRLKAGDRGPRRWAPSQSAHTQTHSSHAQIIHR